MELITLGRSDLRVTPICLGTMVFGEQVDEATSHDLLNHAVARGVNFIDTAEMYAVPARRETYGETERIIGNWFAKNPAMRQRLVLASKAAGPSRGTDWIRAGSDEVSGQDLIESCNASLKRLRTEVIDLYQIHWPLRHVPVFGQRYFDPQKLRPTTSFEAQLRALDQLVRDGKVRYIGLSNETPYGVAEFVRLAEQMGLPRVVSVQNPYCLVNRVVDNGLDETLYHLDVGLLAYSPLAFGLLTGKYDALGLQDPSRPGRLAQFVSMQKQRWGRAEALDAARLYNALARDVGLTPSRLALAFCYRSWRVASTIIGVTSMAQLSEDLDAWDTPLGPDVLARIDEIRLRYRDPAE